MLLKNLRRPPPRSPFLSQTLGRRRREAGGACARNSVAAAKVLQEELLHLVVEPILRRLRRPFLDGRRDRYAVESLTPARHLQPAPILMARRLRDSEPRGDAAAHDDIEPDAVGHSDGRLIGLGQRL